MDASEIEAQDLHDKRMARKARERGWRTALEQIRDMPCSMVNDSESLRHTIKSIQTIAVAALSETQ